MLLILAQQNLTNKKAPRRNFIEIKKNIENLKKFSHEFEISTKKNQFGLLFERYTTTHRGHFHQTTLTNLTQKNTQPYCLYMYVCFYKIIVKWQCITLMTECELFCVLHLVYVWSLYTTNVNDSLVCSVQIIYI